MTALDDCIDYRALGGWLLGRSPTAEDPITDHPKHEGDARKERDADRDCEQWNMGEVVIWSHWWITGLGPDEFDFSLGKLDGPHVNLRRPSENDCCQEKRQHDDDGID